MTTKRISFDISFTPYTIDTYSTFTSDSDEEMIIENYREDTGRDIEYDNIEWNYDHKGFVQNLAEKWCELLNENITDDVIQKIELVGKAYSPREYNFRTDNCETAFTVDYDALKAYIDANKEAYDRDHIKSEDGFMWFGSEEETMLHYYLHTVSKKNYSEWDYMNDVLDDDQATWYNFIDHQLKKELCPNCNTALVYRMHDIDGTNLVEKKTCTECGYTV